MYGVLILISYGLFFLLLGWIFWGMEDTDESFWPAFLDVLSDIFLDFVPGFRAVALLLSFIGFLTIVTGITAYYHPAFLDLIPFF